MITTKVVNLQELPIVQLQLGHRSISTKRELKTEDLVRNKSAPPSRLLNGINTMIIILAQNNGWL